MLSQIAGLLKSDMAKAARLFQAAQSKFLSVLEAYKEKVPAGDAPAAASAGPSDPAETDAATETTDATDAATEPTGSPGAEATADGSEPEASDETPAPTEDQTPGDDETSTEEE
jgi:hypothetical protein